MFGGKQLYAFIGTGTTGISLVTTTNGTIWTFAIPFRCTPIRAGVTVIVAPGTAAPVLTFGAAGICGAITVPTAASANTVYYDETDYKADGTGTWAGTIDEGDTIAVVVSNQSTSTGTVVPWLLVEVNPEQPGNNSAMILTA
jgi:hypothetical protein